MLKKLKQNTDYQFLTLISLLFAVIVIFYDKPTIAMWLGFGIAGYSAIANDSIQTLGTFISSNSKTAWWKLWLYMGFIMIAVFTYSWVTNDGDVSYNRLNDIAQPTNFNILQLSAPVILLILTKYKIPLSTTFLLLSVFSTPGTITAMLQKTALGYVIAFTAALIFWGIITELTLKGVFKEKYNKSMWRTLQWISSGFLWSSWLMQDIANVSVFLPRSLSLAQVIGFAGFLFMAIGLLMYWKGGSIQSVVTEKTDIIDVRSATLIDFVFAIILYIFKEMNHIPMSTTWVFLGLLAGREIALIKIIEKDNAYRKTLKLIMKDVALATIGLLISLLVAFVLNDKIG